MRPFKLQRRDIDLLLALAEGRFVSARQAGRHIWSGQASANRRLATLERQGIIRRQIDRRRGETIIRPTPRGLKLLAERDFLPADSVWSWRHLFERSIGFLEHEVMVNQVRFHLVEACRKTGGRVQLLACRSGPGATDAFIDPSNSSPCRLRPDRYVKLRVPGTDLPQCFFVECDRATRPIRRRQGYAVVDQLERYQRYYRSGQFGKRSVSRGSDDFAETARFRVLFITSSWERAENIMAEHIQDCSNDASHELFQGIAFGVRDEFFHDPLGHVWLRERDGQRLTLVDEWPMWSTY
jgi:DNA-binding MarR family transcriptional regulator